MSRIRVLDLAKELNLDTKTTILKLQEIGVQVKNHFNAVSDLEADKLRSLVRTGKAPEKESAAGGKAAGKVVIRRRAAETEAPEAAAAAPQAPALDVAAQHIAESVAKETPPAPPAPAVVAEEHAPVVAAAAVEDVNPEPIPEPVAPPPGVAASAPVQAPTSPAAATPTAPRTPGMVTGPLIRRGGQPVAPPPVGQGPTVVGGPGSQPRVSVTPPTAGQRPGAPAPATPVRTGFEGAVIVRKAPDQPPPPVNAPQGRFPGPRPVDNRGPQAGVRTYDRAAEGYSQNRPSSYHSGAGPAIGMRSQGPRPGAFGGERGGSGGFQGGGGDRIGGRFNPVGAKPFVLPDAAPGADKSGRPVRDKSRDAQKRRQHEEDEQAAHKRAKGKGRVGDEEELTNLDDYLEEIQGELPEGTEESEAPLRTVYTPVPNRKRTLVGGKKKGHKQQDASPTKASKKIIRIEDNITVADLASEMSVKSSSVIKSLMALGMMATANQSVDFETAALVAQEYGFEVQNTAVSISDILSKKADKLDEKQKEGETRPPVVTIMGHVDHGKTSLLDSIRSAKVAEGEAGGITQHIGAYQVEHNGRKITFLDTPGHEAFTSMRARGAQVTDVVVIVVAADDGVMPQTIEAINHARAAKVPIVVAINKMDKAGVDPDRIIRELAQHNVTPEEWGGDSMFVRVSAKTKQGLPDLLEAILLQADVLDLKAPAEGQAHGVVIEARLDKFRGTVVSVIVTQGVLKTSDVIVAGTSYGRVRAMLDSYGNKITSAGPSTPVEILGLNEVPAAGDQFNGVANDAVAKEAVAYRQEKQRQRDLASQSKATTLDDLFAKMSEETNKAKELPLIIKADTHGSVEAIRAAVTKLDTEKVKTRIIHSAVGGITESDINLARASTALVLGFNVRPDKTSSEIAERDGITIQTYNIIYELIDAVETAMAGRLAPVRSEKVQGHAEVRSLFSVPKVGVIAGSAVLDGKMTRNSHVRVVRDHIVIYTGRIGSLKRFKEDAKEVTHGLECGIGVENYNDLKIGDVLESFVIEETAATLH